MISPSSCSDVARNSDLISEAMGIPNTEYLARATIAAALVTSLGMQHEIDTQLGNLVAAVDDLAASGGVCAAR